MTEQKDVELSKNRRFIVRLEGLKREKFLTNRVFKRVSENMHYEILKFINSRDLLGIRGTNLGGYQITSNKLLRHRIKNYFIKLKPDVGEDKDLVEYISDKGIKLIFTQTGKHILDYDQMHLGRRGMGSLLQILKFNTNILGINLGTYIYRYYTYI